MRLLAILLMILLSSAAEARTWRVERDGSGDFTTIQAAINASSPGDTVLLGPGRYDEAEPFSPKRWPELTYAAITVDSLTLRGVDRETVIIGPTTPDFVGFGPKGIVTHRDITSFLLESVTIENVYTGAYLLAASDVQDCVFQYCYIGVSNFTVGSHVRDSVFLENDRGMSTFPPCEDLAIEDCRFEDNDLGIGVNRTTDAAIWNCEFLASQWTTGGIQFAQNSTGSVEDCSFDGTQDGIAIRASSDVTLMRNVFQHQELSLFVYDGSNVQGSQNEFQGSSAAVVFATTSTATLSDNLIMKTGEWSDHCSGYNLYHVDIDLRNNNWGIDSADSISAWIFDGNDPQPYPTDINMSNVLFEPFIPETVVT